MILFESTQQNKNKNTKQQYRIPEKNKVFIDAGYLFNIQKYLFKTRAETEHAHCDTVCAQV